jgi:hypothetical protein
MLASGRRVPHRLSWARTKEIIMEPVWQNIDISGAGEHLVGHRSNLLSALELLGVLTEPHGCLLVVADGVELVVVTEGAEVVYAEATLRNLYVPGGDGDFEPLGEDVQRIAEAGVKVAARLSRGRVSVEAAGLRVAPPAVKPHMRWSLHSLLLHVAQAIDTRAAA